MSHRAIHRELRFRLCTFLKKLRTLICITNLAKFLAFPTMSSLIVRQSSNLRHRFGSRLEHSNSGVIVSMLLFESVKLRLISFYQWAKEAILHYYCDIKWLLQLDQSWLYWTFSPDLEILQPHRVSSSVVMSIDRDSHITSCLFYSRNVFIVANLADGSSISSHYMMIIRQNSVYRSVLLRQFLMPFHSTHLITRLYALDIVHLQLWEVKGCERLWEVRFLN